MHRATARCKVPCTRAYPQDANRCATRPADSREEPFEIPRLFPSRADSQLVAAPRDREIRLDEGVVLLSLSVAVPNRLLIGISPRKNADRP